MYSLSSQPHPVLTVSELTGQIRFLLEDTFDQVAVVGEISNAKVYPSGHWYFSLKDKDATLPCVCFKNTNASIKFDLQDGLMVVLYGKLSVYPPKGGYQLITSQIQPVGIGEWQLAFEQLREKLELEGLLALERKRSIPIMPRKVGVVTSLAGAALRDVLSALRRRNRHVNIVIAPTKVQGEGSAQEIAQALQNIQTIDDIDVVLVVRGGGSIEDLWSFNTEIVARAVAFCRVPVISGVGHETDITICDLVADLRAPTPTAAAELVAHGINDLIDKWTNLNRIMCSSMETRLAQARHLLEQLSPYSALLQQQERLEKLKYKLKSTKEEMIAQVTHLLDNYKHNWHKQHEKLNVLGPLEILKRGFAVLKDTNGKVISDMKTVKPNDTVEALLYKGKLKLKVESCEDNW